MKKFRARAAASLAAVAAFSMCATPVLAHGYGDWGPYRHRHHDHVDGGDVLAGLLIVGGIAAIASAASKSSRDKQADEPYRYPGSPDNGEPEDRGYGEGPEGSDDGDAPTDRDYGAAPESGYQGSAGTDGGFDSAVDRCANEVENGERRIDTVDNVGRSGDRFEVEGRLEDGRGFACSVDDKGRVRSVAVDGHALI